MGRQGDREWVTHNTSCHVTTHNCRQSPVWAQAIRSRDAEAIGMAYFCTGVGLLYWHSYHRDIRKYKWQQLYFLTILSNLDISFDYLPQFLVTKLTECTPTSLFYSYHSVPVLPHVCDVPRAVFARCLHFHFVVFVEVNSSVVTFKQLSTRQQPTHYTLVCHTIIISISHNSMKSKRKACTCQYTRLSMQCL